MINYPNAKKPTANSEARRASSSIRYPDGRMSRASDHLIGAGKRGMDLEKDINITNHAYLNDDVAVIHKKPTPVQIVKVDYPCRAAAKITEAYFKIPSTTDYNGIYRARYLDFEAKECHSKTSFPLKSIHHHQIDHLDDVLRHGAIAFLIVRFTQYDETFYVKAEDAIAFYRRHERSSMPLKWFHEYGRLIPASFNYPVDYLKIVDQLYFNKEGNGQNAQES